MTVHPPTSTGGGKRPDFLVRSPSGSDFILEAVLATDTSAEDAAADARLNDFYDSLNRLDSPSFFVSIETLNWAPSTPVPGAKVKRRIGSWLSKLDPDEVDRQYRLIGDEGHPRLLFSHEGREVQFVATPKMKQTTTQDNVRPLAMFGGRAGFVQPDVCIRKAIIDKGNRYGELDQPYVIAVNALGDFADWLEVEDALFGKDHLYAASSVERRATTHRDHGAWTSASGARFTGVSAVLAVRKLTPWTLAKAQSRLYHNPWARRRYDGELTSLGQAFLTSSGPEYQEGLSTATVLDLPPEWPEV
jgi:hypothetical protein